MRMLETQKKGQLKIITARKPKKVSTPTLNQTLYTYSCTTHLFWVLYWFNGCHIPQRAFSVNRSSAQGNCFQWVLGNESSASLHLSWRHSVRAAFMLTDFLNAELPLEQHHADSGIFFNGVKQVALCLTGEKCCASRNHLFYSHLLKVENPRLAPSLKRLSATWPDMDLSQQVPGLGFICQRQQLISTNYHFKIPSVPLKHSCCKALQRTCRPVWRESKWSKVSRTGAKLPSLFCTLAILHQPSPTRYTSNFNELQLLSSITFGHASWGWRKLRVKQTPSFLAIPA